MNNPKFNIIFRTCDKVDSLHSFPRPYGLNKKEIIRICFKSLVDFMQGSNYRIIALGDDLADDTLEFLKTFNIELILGKYGNDSSIRKSLDIASEIPDNEYVYFCEDDYLHLPGSIDKVESLIENYESISSNYIYKGIFGKRTFELPLFIFLPDYPDRYRKGFIHPSLIFLSEDYHWRQVKNVTFSFITKAANIKKYSKVLYNSSNNANDAYLSKSLFGFVRGNVGKCMCLSPLPGLATHMHEGVMSPSVDWNKLIGQYQNLLPENK